MSEERSVLEDYTGTLSSSLRQEIRDVGGVFPEQQTFLGATIKSFSVSAGGGSTPKSLNVELIVDPNGTNPTIDDPQKSKGIYDPYHHNQVGDSFSPPGVGMPVFFVYSNPRVTIKEAYEGSSSVSGSVLKFGGLLSSFHSTSSISGHSYSVTVVDPREILSNVYLILNHADEQIGLRENNIYNVFGFLEYNAKESTINKFKSYINNTISRGDGSIAGDDMYHKSLPQDSTSYFDNVGWENKFPITGTGMSRRGSYGIPYYRIMQALSAMSSSSPDPNYDNFSGGIYYRGLSYYISFSNLPPLNPLYFFDHDNIDLLSFFLEVAETCGYEVSISLSPYFGSETGVGGNININFIDRSSESSLGQIQDFINNDNNFPKINGYSLVEKSDLGYELTNPTTSRVLFGANRVDLYAFTSNHDNGRFHQLVNRQGGLGGSYTDQIIPFYGTLSPNVVVPTKGYGPWTQILLDSSGLGAYGVGNYYVATETELRYALKGFKSWKNFLEFYNARFLEVLHTDPKGKYVDQVMGEGIKVVDDEHGDHTKGLKAPRCLFTNDAGYFNNNLINPCCPPLGYPLYYNRAVAIGLTVTKVFDERSSVVADLSVLRSQEGNPAVANQVINALLEKYKKLGRTRRLTAAERDAVKAISSQGPGVDGKYLDSIISSMSGQKVILSKNVETRKENAMKVFSFVKSVAEECYGKKWLVRIPPKPNYKFNKPLSTISNNRVISGGPYGFAPIGSGNLEQACPNNQSFVTTANDPIFNAAQQEFKSGLITNYNPIDDNFVYNYIPDSTGGFLSYNTYLLGVQAALIPQDLTGFGSNHRIKTYVRYDHVEKLNISNSSSKVYTEEVGNRLSAVPSKTASFDSFDAETKASTKIGFIPSEADTQLYYLPTTLQRNVLLCNKKRAVTYYKPYPVTPDASGNLPDNAGNLKSNIQYEPLFAGTTTATTDFPRRSNGQIIPYPNLDYAFALVTIPMIVSTKRDNLNDIPKHQRFNVATYPSLFPDSESLGTVESVKVNRRLDFNNYGAGLTFYNPDRLFSVPAAIKPDLAVIAMEDQQSCYGPWYSGPVRFKDSDGSYKYKQLKNLGGKVDIRTDGSLAPWNFGSYELMNVAGSSQVELAGTLYLASEKGSVSFPGLPMGNIDVGDLIAQGGPILDSISLDVGSDGIRSSYRFQTYSRSFANIQRQQQKQIDILKQGSLKASSMQFDLLHKGLIKNKFRGLPPPAQSFKPYTSAIDSSYTNPNVNNTSITSMTSVSNSANPRNSTSSEITMQASLSSSQGLQDVYEQDPDTLSQFRDNYNSAIEDISSQKIAVSRQSHHLLPGMRAADLEQLESLYDSVNDPYRIKDHHITYWS